MDRTWMVLCAMNQLCFARICDFKGASQRWRGKSTPSGKSSTLQKGEAVARMRVGRTGPSVTARAS